MKKKDRKPAAENSELDFVGFFEDGPLSTISSGESSKVVTRPHEVAEKADLVPAEEEADPVFRLLAEPKLPVLNKRDRARLQLQSPQRIHFYWSVKSNPFKTLEKALSGRIGSYALVAKLRNLSDGSEQIFKVDARGDWWFKVDSDSEYQAEIGFYAPNRPYIRVVYSNKLRTPRERPSSRTDYTPSFAASAGEFAQALDAAGYKKDAFDVALAGDDQDAAWTATMEAYLNLTGVRLKRESERFENDLRFALMALAAGYSLDDIGKLVHPLVHELISKDLSGVTPDDALGALEEKFDLSTDEFEETEEYGDAVFGASIINFPRKLKRRRVPRSLVPKLEELEKHKSVTSFGNR